MKKIIFTIIAVLLLYGMAFANGSCVVTDITSTQISAENNRVPDSYTVDIQLVCTEDASGTFANTTIPLTGYYPQNYLNVYNLTGYYLYQVGRTPGNNSATVTSCSSKCPAGSWTVTATDAYGFALDLGLLANGSATASQMTAIETSTVGYPIVRSALTVGLSGVTNNNAVVTLDLIFKSQ
jgi:hypothetical protein